MPYATFCAEAVRFGFRAEFRAINGACKTSKLCLGFHESKPGINLRKESNMSNEIIGTEAQAKELDAALEELKKVPGPVMKAMQKAQEIYGYLPIEIQSKIAKTFGVSLEEVYGIATFYAQFTLQAKGKYTIGICLGTACYVKGSGDVLLKFKERLGIDAGQTTPDRKFTLDATRCIGCCGLAPVLAVNGEVYGNLKTDDVDTILAKYAE